MARRLPPIKANEQSEVLLDVTILGNPECLKDASSNLTAVVTFGIRPSQFDDSYEQTEISIEVLNVTEESSKDDIEKLAWRELARRFTRWCNQARNEGR